MRDDALSGQVARLLQQQYDRLDARGEVEISPAFLADAAYRHMDPDGAAPLLVRYAAMLELRQLARSICRKRIDDEQEAVEQLCLTGLFDGQLQPRYPARRNGQEVYVKREHLTLSERDAVCARLKAEATAKSRHADAFQAETDALLMQGHFGVSERHTDRRLSIH